MRTSHTCNRQSQITAPRYLLGKKLGARHQYHSACTGKNCDAKNGCARVARPGNSTYSGPLRHMKGNECLVYSEFVGLAEQKKYFLSQSANSRSA